MDDSVDKNAPAPAADDPAALSALATALSRRGDYRGAELLMRRVIAAAPGEAVPHYNLGVVLRKLNRLEESVAAFQAALARRPDLDQASFNLSLSLLALGRWNEAWPLWETRHAGRDLREPALAYPRWRGEPLAGKSLLVWIDDGLGDAIQMFRYAALAQARGAAGLTWLAPAPLTELFQASAPFATVRSAKGEVSLPRHDYWVPAMSLPLLLGAQPDFVPGAEGYLRTPQARRDAWAGRLPPAPLKAGLVWRGHPGHFNNAHRSLPGLETLAPLWDVPGVDFYSLQKGEGEAEAAAPPPGQPLTDLGPQLGDFCDTAAALEQLDLVICVDTSVAHLAGALGRPCLLLLPDFETDWRWMRDRTDTPWYDSLTLLRQQAAGDWSGPVAAAARFMRETLGA